MNESKFLSKKNKSKRDNKFISLLSKIMLAFVLFLVFLIITKKNPELKRTIDNKLFSNNFSFAKINKWYKDKFGSVIPLDDIVPDKEVQVFDEKLNYSKEEKYKDGVKLKVSNNYLIPALDSGVIVFIGEKDNYGKTIIVQQVNGIDVWYGNVDSEKVSLYDYIEKGNLLGEVKDQTLFLAFQKDGEFLNYKEYI